MMTNSSWAFSAFTRFQVLSFEELTEISPGFAGWLNLILLEGGGLLNSYFVIVWKFRRHDGALQADMSAHLYPWKG